jgi:hypothetical protein
VHQEVYEAAVRRVAVMGGGAAGVRAARHVGGRRRRRRAWVRGGGERADRGANSARLAARLARLAGG